MAVHRENNNKSDILIIDDDLTNLKVLSRHLSALGYNPVTADSGMTALKVLDEQPADLILLDIMMPGMDGTEVLNRIKSNDYTKDIPVVMVSAIDDYNTIKKCLEAGAEDYIIKPFNMVLLSSRVESCVARKQPAACSGIG
jgi:response regulator RpfG family c-di-GMP phosphodiesterase